MCLVPIKDQQAVRASSNDISIDCNCPSLGHREEHATGLDRCPSTAREAVFGGMYRIASTLSWEISEKQVHGRFSGSPLVIAGQKLTGPQNLQDVGWDGLISTRPAPQLHGKQGKTGPRRHNLFTVLRMQQNRCTRQQRCNRKKAQPGA